MAIKNTYSPPLVNGTGTVEGELIWVGGQPSDRQDVTLTLYRKTPTGAVETVGTQQISDGTATSMGSKHTWTNLPRTDAATGEEYTYWMDESAVTDPWTKVDNATDLNPITNNTTLTVTNKYTPPKRLVTAVKTWSGGTSLIPRPNVVWTLKRAIEGGTAADVPEAELFTVVGETYSEDNPATLTAPELTITWQTYEKDENGKPYTFTLVETTVPNYLTTIDNSTDPIAVTNTYKPPLVNGNGQVTGNVVWVGGAESDRKDVELKLYRKIGASGTPELVPNSAVTLAAGDAGTHSWQHTWDDELPARDQATGLPYIYFTDETDVPDPWTKVDNETDLNPITDNTTLTVTNLYVAPPVTINASKVWVDGPSTKPSVTMTLYRTWPGNATPEVVPNTELEAGMGLSTDNPVTLSDPWEVSWRTAAKNSDGAAYTFTIDEGTPPANYEKSINNTTYTITNRYVPRKIELTGKKTWIDGQVLRKPVELELYRSVGGGTAEAVPASELHDLNGANCVLDNPVTLTPGNDAAEPNSVSLTAKWCVDQTTIDGETYTYEVKEVSAADPNWTKAESGLEVTNTFNRPLYNNTGNLMLTKRWEGGQPENVAFKLTRETVGVPNSEEDLGTHHLTAANATANPNVWTLTLPNMYAMDTMGRAYKYSVDEPTVPANFEKDVYNDTLTVTNSYNIPRADLEVRVTWENGPDNRPATSVTVTDSNGRTYTVPFPAETISGGDTATRTIHVPITDADGNTLTYKVHQPNVPDTYSEAIDEPAGITLTPAGPNSLGVTNSYVVPVGTIKAKKVWIDGPSTKPSITMTLYRTWPGNAIPQVVPPAELEAGADLSTINPVPLSADPWEVNWRTPLRTINGEPYTFTIDEGPAPANYEKSINNTSYTITNRYVPRKIELTGKKTWIDGQVLRKPVELELYRSVGGGTAEAVPASELHDLNGANCVLDNPVTLTPGNDAAEPNSVSLTAKWCVDQTTIDGETYTYEVKEVSAADPNWTKAESGLEVTNTFNRPLYNNTGNLMLTKRWEGGQPENVAFKLTRETVGVPNSEEDLGTHHLTAANATANPNVWTLTLPNMYAMDTMGRAYKYSVDEPTVPANFEKDVYNDTLTVTNSYNIPRADLEVRVTWENGPDNRPATSVTVTDSNGRTYTVPFPAETISGGDTATRTIHVPITDADGNTLTYKVHQPNVPDTYSEAIDEPAGITLTPAGPNSLGVTNSYVVPVGTIKAKKVWIDGPSTKPSITMTLYRTWPGNAIPQVVPPAELEAGADLSTINPVPLSADPWEVNWRTPLRTINGEPYTFTIDEGPAPANYEKSINNTSYTITNRYVTPKIEVIGKKTWIDGQMLRRPVELMLYRSIGGAAMEAVPAADLLDQSGANCVTDNPVTLTPIADASQPNSVTMTAKWCVEETTIDGETITYEVKEVSAADPNWTKAEAGLEVTNTFNRPLINNTGSLVLTKRWQGGQPVNVTFKLSRETAGVPGSEDLGDYPLTAANATSDPNVWTLTLTNMYATDMMGRAYAYKVDEAPVPDNFDKEVDNGTLTITNTYEVPRADLEVRVTWENGPNDRPSTSVTVTDNNGRTYVVPFPAESVVSGGTSAKTIQVPMTDANGNPLRYTVHQPNVPDSYSETIDEPGGITLTQGGPNSLGVTNSYVVPVGTIKAKKVWVNGPNPKPNVTLTLYRALGSAAPQPVPDVELEAGPGLSTISSVPLSGDPWEVNWKTALRDINGVPYTFSVDEGTPPANYEKSIDNTTYTVTNRYVSPKIEVVGQKNWINGQVLRKPVQLALFRSVGGGTPTQIPQNELRDLGAGSNCVLENPTTLTPSSDAGEPNAVSLVAKWCVDENDANGDPYTFEVREVSAADPNWTKAESGLDVTNTFNQGLVNNDGNLVLTKRWQGGRPVNVTFKLTREIVGSTDPAEDLGDHNLTAANATSDPRVWTLTIPNMHSTDELGRAYVYKIDEVPVPANFQKEIDTGRLTVTNVYQVPQTDLEVRVTWENGPDGRPATSVTVTDNNGRTYAVPFPAGSIVSGGSSTQTIRVPMTDADGNLLRYRVNQPNVPDSYEERIDEPAGITLTEGGPNRLGVTNKYVSPKDQVSATKVWVNGETLARPEIWFKLYRQVGGGAVQEVPLAEAPLKKLENGTTVAVWTNIEMNSASGDPYVFSVKEVNASGADFTPAAYTKVESGLTVTNTFAPVPVDVTGRKVWGLGPSPRPTVWLKLYRQIAGGAVEEVPAAEAPIKEVPDGTTTATWTNMPSATLRGEPYVYSVREVNASGAPFTPAGYDKKESGLTVTNAKLSRLKVNLITTPMTSQQFEIEVKSDTDVRPTHRLDYDGIDTNVPSSFIEDNMIPTLYRINIPKLDPEIWSVEGIMCVMRPLDSTDPALDEPLQVIPKLDVYGKMTGEFTIPDIPVEKDVDCTYTLRNKTAGRIIVKNMTYPNVTIPGIPTYNYRSEGVGYDPFALSTTMAPNVQDVVPGMYTIAQQNLDGWVTIDMIVTSSVFGRRPAKYGGEARVNGSGYGPDPSGFSVTGWESLRTIEVHPKEEVTITFVNVPPNSIMLKKETIPSGVNDKFEFEGILSGTIGDGEYLIRTNLQPDGKQHQAIERLGDGWSKHTVFCVEKGTVGTTETRPEFYTMSAYYGLDEGEVILCTFVNRQWGSDEFPDIYDDPIAAHSDHPNGMPRTGFAPGKITALPMQSAEKLYNASELKLSISKLGVSLPIVGVPNVRGEWDVTWLNNQAGYLHGSTYPTWEGNSVITAHVWDAHNNPGPFANLKTLSYGDQVEIQGHGKTYVYEVRESKQVHESNVEAVMSSKTGTWITLLTCEDYSEKTSDYRFRRVVEAVLVDVK